MTLSSFTELHKAQCWKVSKLIEDLREKKEQKVGTKNICYGPLYIYGKRCIYIFQNWALGYIFIPQYKGKYIPNKAMLFQQSKG